MADLFTGVYAATAILAALQQRARTGEGAHVDMALLDTQAAVLGNQALNWMTSGVTPERVGNGRVNLVPYQSFATCDADVIIAVGNDRQFGRLCLILQRPDLAADPRFATNPARVVNRQVLIPELCALVQRWSSADILAALEADGVPAGPVNRIDGVFADPQVQPRGMCLDVARPDGELLPSLASPIVIDGLRATAASAAPDRLSPASDLAWRKA